MNPESAITPSAGAEAAAQTGPEVWALVKLWDGTFEGLTLHATKPEAEAAFLAWTKDVDHDEGTTYEQQRNENDDEDKYSQRHWSGSEITAVSLPKGSPEEDPPEDLKPTRPENLAELARVRTAMWPGGW